MGTPDFEIAKHFHTLVIPAARSGICSGAFCLTLSVSRVTGSLSSQAIMILIHIVSTFLGFFNPDLGRVSVRSSFRPYFCPRKVNEGWGSEEMESKKVREN